MRGEPSSGNQASPVAYAQNPDNFYNLQRQLQLGIKDNRAFIRAMWSHRPLRFG